MTKVYTARAWQAWLFLAMSLMFLYTAVSKFTAGRSEGLVRIESDDGQALDRFKGGNLYITVEQDGHEVLSHFTPGKDPLPPQGTTYFMWQRFSSKHQDLNNGVLNGLMFLMAFSVFCFDVKGVLVLGESDIQRCSFLSDRRVAYDDVAWFDLYHNWRAVLGRQQGASLSINLTNFKQRDEIVARLKERLGDPTIRKLRLGPVLAVLVVAAGGAVLGMHFSMFAYVLALAAGIATAMGFQTIERRIPVQTLPAALAGMCLLVLGLSALVEDVALGRFGSELLLATIMLFAGWLGAFYLTRVYNGYRRGIIGPDWAETVAPETET